MRNRLHNELIIARAPLTVNVDFQKIGEGVFAYMTLGPALYQVEKSAKRRIYHAAHHDAAPNLLGAPRSMTTPSHASQTMLPTPNT